ncbi:MAG: DUF6427 family protein [Allomuricauda sp.]
MFSSFFGKTKPINYIVLSVFLLLFYASHVFFEVDGDINKVALPLELLTFGALLLSIFIINQIVRTEKVTDFNSYAMLFYVLLLVTFSKSLTDKNAIFANFFLLLAIWRLLSIKSVRNVKHKIFDGSILVALASLFFDWTLLFLILVLLAINVYDRKNFKNWLVPFMGIATLFILTFTTLKVYDGLSFFEEHYQFSMAFLDIEAFRDIVTPKLVVYVLLMFVVMFFVFLRARKIGGGKLILLRIVFLAFLLGLAINLFRTEDTSPILITFFPAAVFLTNYLEGITRPRLQELALSLCIVVPILLFVLELNR